ncbi:MAG: GntR family transcriptional regulator [Victivallaceae bacterium]|nr:GntR family transcriptional regulator [Victivallaceae bacterium]
MLKYQQAKQQILEKVYSLSPGQSLPPVRSLIKELGYSQVTLKRAFDDLELEGILKRVKGAGIFVADLECNSSCVGVLMPYLVPKIYSQILAGIQNELAKNMLNLLLLPCHCAKWDVIYELIKKEKLTKLIVNPSSADLFNIDFINFIHKLSDDGIDLVVIDIPIPGLKADYIGFENSAAFTQLTRKIIDNSVKILTVAGKFDSKVYSSRLKGIRDAIEGKNIKLHQIDVSDSSLPQIAMELAASRADAIILCDAGSSVNLLYELKSALGDAITTIRIGGIVEQTERLPLKHAVTIEKQGIQMGKTAVDMILRQKDRPEVKLLPIEIII